MKVVHKYGLFLYGKTEIQVSENAKIVLVGAQEHKLFIWVENDQEPKTVIRRFHVIGAGFELDENLTHIGSFQDDVFVWHVYEEKIK